MPNWYYFPATLKKIRRVPYVTMRETFTLEMRHVCEVAMCGRALHWRLGLSRANASRPVEAWLNGFAAHRYEPKPNGVSSSIVAACCRVPGQRGDVFFLQRSRNARATLEVFIFVPIARRSLERVFRFPPLSIQSDVVIMLSMRDRRSKLAAPISV